MGEHSASIPHQGGQEFVFNGGEMDLLLGDVHLPSSQVDAQITHRKRRLARLLGGARGVAQRHTQPRQQFANTERLGQVVIGASIKAVTLSDS